jgi:hypothetical protein
MFLVHEVVEEGKKEGDIEKSILMVRISDWLNLFSATYPQYGKEKNEISHGKTDILTNKKSS